MGLYDKESRLKFCVHVRHGMKGDLQKVKTNVEAIARLDTHI
jgi:hypothetical protein